MTMNTDFGEIALRLVVALLIGAAIGTQRHLHSQAAGLRTHALVALAAALAVLIVAPLPGGHSPVTPDAESRVLQGILTGVGFIGAGLILYSARGGNAIRGLTSAAVILDRCGIRRPMWTRAHRYPRWSASPWSCWYSASARLSKMQLTRALWTQRRIAKARRTIRSIDLGVQNNAFGKIAKKRKMCTVILLASVGAVEAVIADARERITLGPGRHWSAGGEEVIGLRHHGRTQLRR